jgi:hypothetical protein
MRHLIGLTVVLLLALGGVARAANVDVDLVCDGCFTSPEPAILNVGDTLTFACPVDACAPMGCEVFHQGGSISGITPFQQFIPTGETGSPLGPATAGGEYAVVFVLNDLCLSSFYGSLKTVPGVSTVPSYGVPAVAILMLVAGFVVFLRKRPGGEEA